MYVLTWFTTKCGSDLFSPLTLSSDDTSGQHGNAEQNNMDNKHFSDNLNVYDYKGNTSEASVKMHNDFSFYLL
ncbi:unnamed protein product [Brugia pahangi]|uniref:Ovule protein n=1 Tax=Brugia pahangi TaxID=6280 RepID=A0A0N4U065_BRUPA|nr:unnamed protein product [Brugia pahangi]